MRIAYVNHSRFPTEKAHGLQVARVCGALASIGYDVTLVTPTMRGADASAAFAFYGMEPSFRIEQLRHFDAFQSRFVPGVLGFAVTMHFYARALGEWFRRERFDALYVRSPLLVRPLLLTGMPLVLELHALPEWNKARFASACNRCRLVVCLTAPMRDELRTWGVSPERMMVEGDGVDLEQFRDLPSVAAAKERWALPPDRTVMGYVGSLVTREVLEKGVREYIDALALARKQGHAVLGWIVGGPEKWVKIYRAHAASRGLTEQDIRFQGRIAARDVPSALAACDLLVYPAPPSAHPYFQRDTSPLKLFEYLAAGKPVLCADLPPLRGVVDAQTVRLVRPGDAASLADGMADALRHPAEAQARAAAGRALAARHDWKVRMRRITDAMV